MEQQKNTDSEFNFFEERVVKKVNRQSYKKLAFLALSIGIATSIGVEGMSMFKDILVAHKVQSAQEQSQEQIQAQAAAAQALNLSRSNMDYYKSQIKGINQSEFNGFVNYLKANQNIYDEQINIAIDADFNSGVKKEYATEVAQNLNDALSDYKKHLEGKVNNFEDVYARVQTGNTVALKENNYKDFLDFYHNYQANIFTVNKDMEKSINKALYDGYDNIAQYNRDHGTINKAKSAMNEQNETLKKLKM